MNELNSATNDKEIETPISLISAPTNSCALANSAAPPSHERPDQPFRRLHYMYGAVSQIELNYFLESASIDSALRKREIKLKWLEASQRFEAIAAAQGGTPEAIDRRSLSGESEGYLEKLKAMAMFRAISS